MQTHTGSCFLPFFFLLSALFTEPFEKILQKPRRLFFHKPRRYLRVMIVWHRK